MPRKLRMEEQTELTELRRHIAELHQKMDGQCVLLYQLIQADAIPSRTPEQPPNNQVSYPCRTLGGSLAREKRLIASIQEAILVLEQSRRAFRSKQLENLRKKMIQTLVEMKD